VCRFRMRNKIGTYAYGGQGASRPFEALYDLGLGFPRTSNGQL
jgi:hypothetical protein